MTIYSLHRSRYAKHTLGTVSDVINDLKWRLRQPPEPKYNLAERVLFIGGGVVDDLEKHGYIVQDILPQKTKGF
jgi:hypothetical protein